MQRGVVLPQVCSRAPSDWGLRVRREGVALSVFQRGKQARPERQSHLFKVTQWQRLTPGYGGGAPFHCT